MTKALLVMFFLAAGVLAPVVLPAADSVDKRPVLKTGFVEFPPFKYVDDEGNASGPWIEMTDKVAAEAGYRVQWVHLPIARVYLYLQNGEIDLWPGVAGIPAIQASVFESTVTPMEVVLYAFHRSSAEPPDSLEFLVGQPLILINGFSYLGVLEKLPLKDSDLSYAPGHKSALRMLELGRGRYVLDYDEPVKAVQKEFSALNLTGTPIFEARGAFIVSRTLPDAKTVVNRFDQAYQRLMETGELAPLQ
jgi:polar amino acid transport system substrate-binding protein